MASGDAYLIDDYFQYAFNISHHIIVPEPDDPIAVFLDQLGPRSILDLIVLAAIEFHNQPDASRCEVSDIGANGKLFDEFGVRKLPTAQASPKLALGLGHIAAESAGSLG